MVVCGVFVAATPESSIINSPPVASIVIDPSALSVAVNLSPKFKVSCGVFVVMTPESSTVIVLPDPVGPCAPSKPFCPRNVIMDKLQAFSTNARVAAPETRCA